MDDSEAKRTFTVLRPLCTQLLELATTRPDECARVLDSLEEVLRTEPQSGLRVCMEYVLFPIMRILDAATACRANQSSKDGQKRLYVGDKVAEGAVVCLRRLLDRCPCKSALQMTTLLRKLSATAMLSPAEASEEFRHGVILCLRSLFEGLQACGSSYCSCKHVIPSPFCILKLSPSDLYEGYSFNEEKGAGAMESTTAADFAPEDCPVEYLQSIDIAPAIGLLLSLLLQIAEKEASQGGVGCGKLREDALSTLRNILLKVGNADALAFFLPGVASGFSKAIRSSMVTSRRSVTTATYKSVGAAGSTGALEESVRGFTELLALVLADSRNWSCLPDIGHEGTNVGQGIGEVEAALEKLQDVLLKENYPEAGGDTKAGVPVTLETSGLGAGDNSTQKRTLSNAESAVPGLPSFRLERDRKWLESTVLRLETLLSESLPLLCAHPAPAVRLAVVESASVLLFSCGGTLENCTSLFLECLLALACDEWQSVSSAANSSLLYLTSIDEILEKIEGGHGDDILYRSRCIQRSKLQQAALLNVLERLLEKLPQAAFAGNDTSAVLHARRLAAALYFLGPDAVHSSFLGSLEAFRKFVKIMLQCLSFSSTFAGPINLTSLASASKSTPLLVMSEPKTSTVDEQLQLSNSLNVSEQKHQKVEVVVAADMLPRKPPWLSENTCLVYKTYACIIRLVGRAAVSGRPGDPALMRLVEILSETLQQAENELRQQQEKSKQSMDIGHGQVQRLAATSACILNEIIYGASGVWTDQLPSFFGGLSPQHSQVLKWQRENGADAKVYITECMGGILHDYLSPEIWELPVAAASYLDGSDAILDMPLLHVLQDNAMFQQVLVEGIGVFGIALGMTFEHGGFLALVLYPLLEKLGSTSFNVSSAANIALRAICCHTGYQSVKELVIKNADYVVDSLCRQLRHLTLHPQAPSLLAAIFRHTGAAPHLLPLLEEPMYSIVLELEVPARRRHPEYMVPLLQALREIARAARVEGGAMLTEASSTAGQIKAAAKEGTDMSSEAGQQVIEIMITTVQETERRRKSVVSVATSCLHACAPLLASRDPQTCILVLDTFEDGIAGLADMEAAFHHIQTQRTLVEGFLANSADMLGDPDNKKPFGTHDDDIKSNVLLPSMNQVWPQLIPCLRHTQPAILVRVLGVIANVISSCGGQFFTRRIATDALPLLLKLLREGPPSSMKHPSDTLKPKSSKEMLLLKTQGSEIRETGTSSAAILKVQQAVLRCIQTIAGDAKSAPALDSTYKPIVASIVGLACKVHALQADAAEALFALSNGDPDLVWLLVADLVYGGQSNGLPSPGHDFLSFTTLFPAVPSSQDALWVQYCNYNGDSVVDRKAAQALLAKIECWNQGAKK